MNRTFSVVDRASSQGDVEGGATSGTRLSGYIYLVTNLVNGKKYVGCTSRSVQDRWIEHLRSARKGSPLAVHAAIRKYGKEDFKVEILTTVTGTYEDLMAAEVCQITTHRCVAPLGYNLTNGGDGVDFSVPEVRERMMQRAHALQCDVAWQKNVAEANRKKAVDPLWRKAQKEGARKRSHSPEWQRHVTEANRRKVADPVYRQALVSGLAQARAGYSASIAVKDASLPVEERVRRAKQREQGRLRQAAYKARKKSALVKGTVR